MINLEELSTKLIYYRAINKISITTLAKKIGISVNTLQKIIKKQYVKEITKIYVWEKFEKIEKGEI